MATTFIEWYRNLRLQYSKAFRYSTVLVELALFAFIMQTGIKHFPLSTSSLWATTGPYQQLWGYRERVQSTLHGRFEEVCTDYFYQYVLIDAVSDKLKVLDKEPVSEIVKVIRFVHFYNSWSAEIQHADCSKEWEYEDISWWIGHHFQYSLPFSWLMEKFGLSEIYICLLTIIGSWFGLYCFYLLTKRMTGSRFFGLVAVVILTHFLKDFFAGVEIYFWMNLFPVMLIGQLWASPGRLFGNVPRFVKYIIEILLLLAFGYYVVLYQFYTPAYIKLSSIVIVLTLFLLSLVRFNRKIFIRAIIVLAVYMICLSPFKNYCSSLFKPLGSGSITLPAMTWMLYERPNHLGFPYTDPVVPFVAERDPFINNNYQFLMFFHSVHSWGRMYFKFIITHRPWIYLDAWWKRLYTSIRYHREISYGMFAEKEDFTIRFFYIGVATFFIACLIPGLINRTWIPASVLFLQLFGIDMLMTVIHAHPPYSASGFFLLFSLFPGFLCAIIIYMVRSLLVRLNLRENV